MRVFYATLHVCDDDEENVFKSKGLYESYKMYSITGGETKVSSQIVKKFQRLV